MPPPQSVRGRRRAALGLKTPTHASRSALVLGGGGFTGGVYEIGALRALDLLSVNRTVNEFDVYVGTSAGSFVARRGRQRRDARGDDAGDRPAGPDLVPGRAGERAAAAQLRRVPDQGRAAPVPRRAARRARWCAISARSRRSTSPSGLAEVAAVGPVLGAGDRALRARRSCPTPTAPTTSGCCTNELYLAATDLDTCERIVFGAEGWDDVPISTAVSASSALPMIYKPVRIKDRELVDGGILSTTNLDIAVEAGAKFIVVVNPLVPYVNDFEKRIPTITGLARAARVGHGVPAHRLPDVQAARLPAAARARAALGGALSGRRHHPDRARAQRRADVPDQRR